MVLEIKLVRYVSYYRVSTAKQGVSGLGLDAQRAEVIRYIKGDVIAAEYIEIESGKRNDRPQLAAAIAYAKKHKAILIIAKLDRLARNVHFVSGLMESRVDFVACDLPQANKLTIHIMAAMAEHEADAISVRTKAALAQAKKRGKKLGGLRESHNLANARAVHIARAEARNANVRPVIAEIRTYGVTTLKGVAAALNARGIRTARGHAWSATQVSRVLAS